MTSLNCEPARATAPMTKAPLRGTSSQFHLGERRADGRAIGAASAAQESRHDYRAGRIVFWGHAAERYSFRRLIVNERY